MKTAIVQVADTGPLESLALMLRSAGYICKICGPTLNSHLRSLGLDTVLDINDLIRSWGYEQPFVTSVAEIHDLATCDLFVDVKAHRNGPKLWKMYPGLKERTLWYRINGGKPEHVIQKKGTSQEFDCGDEINPPCPVLTPNQWYGHGFVDVSGNDTSNPWATVATCRSYSCWPPFCKFGEYYDKRARTPDGPPICLIHRVDGWGYQRLVPEVRALGVGVYGVGSPDGLINHSVIPSILARSKCMVHLKSNDAPGYALYEALAAGCPIILPRRLIWRCKMQELFIPGETCLVFDRETHDGLSDQDVTDCKAEIAKHLEALKDSEYNLQIGLAGHYRLKELMWSEEKDGKSLRTFMTRHFG